MTAKYLRFPGNRFIVWNTDISHSGMSRSQANLQCHKPVSAGFATITQDAVLLHGESCTLGLKSLPDDTEAFINSELL